MNPIELALKFTRKTALVIREDIKALDIERLNLKVYIKNIITYNLSKT